MSIFIEKVRAGFDSTAEGRFTMQFVAGGQSFECDNVSSRAKLTEMLWLFANFCYRCGEQSAKSDAIQAFSDLIENKLAKSDDTSHASS